MIQTREQKKASSLLKRRKIAIIASILVIAILATSLVFVLDFYETITYPDLDGTKYYIRKENGVYAMYDADKNILSTEEVYGCYVTKIGTLVKVDAATGEYTVKYIPATYEGETTEYEKILIFPHIETSDIRQIEVHNQYDSFTVRRFDLETMKPNDDSDFVLKESPFVTLDQNVVTMLAARAGYSLALERLDDPMMLKDENGKDTDVIDYAEYGLISETRVDEEGNEYEYTPSSYTLTDKSGNKYKMIIGDRLVTGTGYYVQYVDMQSGEARPTVYIRDDSIANSLLIPVEELVTPELFYPTDDNNYFDVQNFSVLSRKDDGYEKTVQFSYVDIADRTGTILGLHPYVFSEDTMPGYHPTHDSISSCLNGLSSPEIVGIKKLSPTNEDFVEYGLKKLVVDENGNRQYAFDAEHIVSYEQTTKASDGSENILFQTLYISKPNEEGNYYTFSVVYSQNDKGEMEYLYDYDMICEVYPSTLQFVTWDKYDWINPSYMEVGIIYTHSIKLESDYFGYDANFILNHTKSPEEGSESIFTSIDASDSKGNAVTTLGGLHFYDLNGYEWIITAREVMLFDSQGNEMSISTASYEHNILGDQTTKIDGYISRDNGDLVYVDTNEVRIVSLDGTVTKYCRWQTDLFRLLFGTITSSYIVDSYEMTEEEEAALLADPSKHMMRITLTDDESTKVYDMYYLTARKAYLTINGVGGFYVNSSRIEKMVNDCAKFFAQQPIDYNAKN